jgi:hypothetical protein
MYPGGRLEYLLGAFGQVATRSLLAVFPSGGQAGARRNAAGGAVAASVMRREREQIDSWVAARSAAQQQPDPRIGA